MLIIVSTYYNYKYFFIPHADNMGDPYSIYLVHIHHISTLDGLAIHSFFVEHQTSEFDLLFQSWVLIVEGTIGQLLDRGFKMRLHESKKA